MKVYQLFEVLETYKNPIPLNDLESLLSKTLTKTTDLESFINFSEESYQRNKIIEKTFFEVYILCWKGGQKSPIHDHKGSTCGLKVISGVATETIFTRKADGKLYAASSSSFVKDQVIGSQDEDIHQIANLQNEDLITIHIYSPPLKNMATYSLEN